MQVPRYMRPAQTANFVTNIKVQEWKVAASKGATSGEQKVFIDSLRPDAGVNPRTDRLLR